MPSCLPPAPSVLPPRECIRHDQKCLSRPSVRTSPKGVCTARVNRPRCTFQAPEPGLTAECKGLARSKDRPSFVTPPAAGWNDPMASSQTGHTTGLADPNLWTNRLYSIDLGLSWYPTAYSKVYLVWEHVEF